MRCSYAVRLWNNGRKNFSQVDEQMLRCCGDSAGQRLFATGRRQTMKKKP